MHRSGTSAITRTLNLCGVYLGPPQHLLGPAPDNPKGFWEHRGVVELNDQILSRLGGGALEPPRFVPEWQLALALKDLQERARNLFEQDFSAAGLWGWKDPRTCLTLPFWQNLVPRMSYVICLRNPLSVVESLQRRDGVSLTRGIYLWFTYLRLSFIHTHRERRILVFYEDLMQDCVRQMKRLAHFLNRSDQAERDDIQRALQAFVDSDLHHHRSPTVASPGLDGPSAVAQALHMSGQVYHALRQRSTDSDDVEELIARGLDLLTEEILAEEQEKAFEWKQRLEELPHLLAAMVSPGASFILVDDEQTGCSVPDRRRFPFLEHRGEYWGPPADDATAIRELERLRRNGATAIVFAWPAFWWLTYYSGFHEYLHRNARCLVQNDRVVAFELCEPALTIKDHRIEDAHHAVSHQDHRNDLVVIPHRGVRGE
jgi:hypothetical protein